MNHLKKKFYIPIYEANLWVIVTNDIVKSRKDMNTILGEYDDLTACTGLCSHNGGDCFALFFEQAHITSGIIAHEIFHLTHDMLHWTNSNFDISHDEQGALLHGYLMGLVYPLVIEFKE